MDECRCSHSWANSFLLAINKLSSKDVNKFFVILAHKYSISLTYPTLFYTQQWNQCIYKTNKNSIFIEWNDMIWITSDWYQPILSLVIDITFLYYLWLFHSLNAAFFESSNDYNFLGCEQKHQVRIGIYLVRHEEHFGTKIIQICFLFLFF